MASSSIKKIASSNTQKLSQLHIITGVILTVSLLIITVFKRPSNWKYFILFNIPLAACQYTIEKSGRPIYKYDNVGQYDKLVNSGIDLSQSGLTEYMFDIIYVSWGLDIFTIILGTLKVWYLFLVVPAFAIFKLSGFIKAFFPKGEANTAAPTAVPDKQEKSKRQQKLEKNGRRKVVR